MEEKMETDPHDPVFAILERHIARHSFWRKTMSVVHTVASSGTILFSAAAAVFGAKYGFSAAIFAGIATICASIEKGLKISEKWSLHLKTETSLEILKLRLESNAGEQKEIIQEIASVLNRYATELQVEETVTSDIARLKKEMAALKA